MILFNGRFMRSKHASIIMVYSAQTLTNLSFRFSFGHCCAATLLGGVLLRFLFHDSAVPLIKLFTSLKYGKRKGSIIIYKLLTLLAKDDIMA